MKHDWPDIIRAAASSPLGIVALVALILGGDRVGVVSPEPSAVISTQRERRDA
jgi:hypothetical protein